jgi:hypothetical protein
MDFNNLNVLDIMLLTFIIIGLTGLAYVLYDEYLTKKRNLDD